MCRTFRVIVLCDFCPSVYVREREREEAENAAPEIFLALSLSQVTHVRFPLLLIDTSRARSTYTNGFAYCRRRFTYSFKPILHVCLVVGVSGYMLKHMGHFKPHGRKRLYH